MKCLATQTAALLVTLTTAVACHGQIVLSDPAGPTAPVVSISPQEPEPGGDDLVCVFEADSTDTDGDELSYTLQWQVEDEDGVLSSVASSALSSGDHENDTVNGEGTESGDTWTCSVTVRDGQAGEAVGTASVEVVGSGYSSVSAGYAHTCAINASGSIQCWGWNEHGQVSDASTGSGYSAVSAGGRHTCAINTSGGFECWGIDDGLDPNDYGQVSDAP